MIQKSIQKIEVLNIKLVIGRIRKESPILAEMEQKREIEMVEAAYYISGGNKALDKTQTTIGNNKFC